MFHQRLSRARKAAGLSLRSLGEQVGLSHTAIKKYEDGELMPASDLLLKFSRALKVRTEYFFRPDTIALEGVEYRKRSSLPKKQLSAITHEIIDKIERRIELENLFPQPPVKPFELVTGLPARIESLDEIESIANKVRSDWGLGFSPVLDLIDALETHGVRVFVVQLGASDKFDGLAAKVNNMPLVVVGENWPGDRQRFTLAHELGHLMLSHRLADGIDEEKACNRFAGAFLLPDASLRQELGMHRSAIELKELGLLKEEFGLSMMGILYRALNLKIISQSCFDSLMWRFRNNGWNRKEPGNPYPSEKAHVFEQLIFHALAEDYISESKAAELMNMKLSDFRCIRSLGNSDAVTHQ
ncbi:helix-turn-helix domain-containing protein [Iodobacter ciconiae]|uniref:ImmA/IrrE family metallo-endopeptidase n=1 Tax=Iodobacter ciconiae TaxID=2496266 RepID=A0A3S8ZN65_9NEIS|nr:XRE family transcriptional regulator [Iodobacter ciconiae]AZN35023.1 ImmA/IrrE family metallo-endopeptidase [Iodobacter ciconiae]